MVHQSIIFAYSWSVTILTPEEGNLLNDSTEKASDKTTVDVDNAQE